MKKIVLLPLDERPCNYDFVYKLFQSDELQIVRPEQLGSNKTPADATQVKEFLLQECEQAFGLILSVDMLLYGGLIPSRIHKETVETLKERSISPHYNAERNMAEVMRYICQKLSEGKRVTVADNAYSNGGELDVIRMLNKHDILLDLSAYAGWNTNGNTLGTVLAQAVYDYYYGNTKQRKDFLVERYLEDVAYCSYARGIVTKEIAAEEGAFATEEGAAKVAERARKHLEAFAKEYLSSITDHIRITHVSMPWKRMFEVKLDAEFYQ